MDQSDRQRFSVMALKAKGYVELIHEEAKTKFYSAGENYMDEWLEHIIQETEELLHELETMIDKYNCTDVNLLENCSYNCNVENHKIVRMFK